MIYIFHGENLGASRAALVELKKKYVNLDSFTPEKADDFEEIFRAAESVGMFAEDRLIVVEGPKRLFGLTALVNYLESKPATTHFALWSDEELSEDSPLLSLAKKTGGQVFHFPGAESKPFPFLDALGARQKVRALRELNMLLRIGENPLGLLALIVNQFRSLLHIKFGTLPEKTHPYVRRKITIQSGNFSINELLVFYRRLLKLEVDLKLGGEPRGGLMGFVEAVTDRS